MVAHPADKILRPVVHAFGLLRARLFDLRLSPGEKRLGKEGGGKNLCRSARKPLTSLAGADTIPFVLFAWAIPMEVQKNEERYPS